MAMNPTKGKAGGFFFFSYLSTLCFNSHANAGVWEVKCYAEGLKLMAPLHSEIRAGFSEKGGTTGGWRSKDGKCQEACSKTKILCQAYLISQVSVTNM